LNVEGVKDVDEKFVKLSQIIKVDFIRGHAVVSLPDNEEFDHFPNISIIDRMKR
jgi:hypothetical protein